MKFCLPWNKDCRQPEPERVWKGTLCPCWDNDWTLCLHPEASVVERRNISMYADEPESFKLVGHCQYKRYTGVTIYQPRSMTRVQYLEYLENHTGCFHPKEYDYADKIVEAQASL